MVLMTGNQYPKKPQSNVDQTNVLLPGFQLLIIR